MTAIVFLARERIAVFTFAELVKHSKDWQFAGAVVPGYPDLPPLEEDFWPLFWKLHLAARAPDAGNIKRPAIS